MATYDQYEKIESANTDFDDLRKLILVALQKRSKGVGTSSIVRQDGDNFIFNRNILKKYKNKYQQVLTALSEDQFSNIDFINAKATINAMAELMIENSPEVKNLYDIIPALSEFYEIINDWNNRNDTIDEHGCEGACSGLCSGVNSNIAGNPLPGNRGEPGGGWSGNCAYSCDSGCDDTCKGNCYGDTSGFPSGPCGEGCSALCHSTCRQSCENGCINECTQSCNNGCSSSCLYACESNCTNYCGDNCSGGCGNSCQGCGGTCSEKCGSNCGSNCQYGAYSGCSDCRNFCSSESNAAALIADTSTDLFPFLYEKNTETHEEAYCDYIEEGNNWILYCYESGTLTILGNSSYNVDIHAVGGGGAGGGPFANIHTGSRQAGHGGGSGYIKTKNSSLSSNTNYTISIGAGGLKGVGSSYESGGELMWLGGKGEDGGETYLQDNNSIKIISAPGGKGGTRGNLTGNAGGGGNGGSGGATGGGNNGGSNCGNGIGAHNDLYGYGQAAQKPNSDTDYSLNAYDFMDNSLTLRAKGGNGGPNGNMNGIDGLDNTGDGGQGAGSGTIESYQTTAGNGGSGILIIRNHRE